MLLSISDTMDKEALKLLNLLLGIIAMLVLFVILGFIIAKEIKKEKHLPRREKIQRRTFIGIFSALSFVLYMVKISAITIFPTIPFFLDIQFSSVPIFIGGFLYGPVTGVIIALVRMALKAPFTGTLLVGELMDLIIGISTVLVSSSIYRKDRTKKGAIKALVAASFTWVVIAFFSNWAFILKFYISLYGFGSVFGMLSVIPNLNENNYMWRYLLLANLPFNILLSTLVSIVTFAVYKRVSTLARDYEINEGIVETNTAQITQK